MEEDLEIININNKIYSIEDLEKIIKEIIEPSNYSDYNFSWNSEDFKNKSCSFIITQMYDYVNFNSKVVLKLCRLFQTDNIETDQSSRRGCETCDYGSSYQIDFYIKEVGSMPELALLDIDNLNKK